MDVEELMRSVEKRGREQAERRAEAEARLAASRSLYSDEQNQPVLRPSFVLYMDTLGTKARLRNFGETDLRNQVERLDGIRSWIEDDDDELTSFRRTLSFTDNVVVGQPVQPDWEGGWGLGLLLDAATFYVARLACDGDFSRGGVATGDFYADDRFATGEALLDAVLIEETTAVYPRIVISDLTYDVVREDMDAVGELGSPWNDTLLVDSDGKVFLNYLDALRSYDKVDLAVESLRLHSEHIAAALGQADDGAIRDKYVWLADYHNFVVDEFWSPRSAEMKIAVGLSEREVSFPRKFRRLVA